MGRRLLQTLLLLDGALTLVSRYDIQGARPPLVNDVKQRRLGLGELVDVVATSLDVGL